MPGHLMRRAQQIAVGVFTTECASFDITPVQYATLVAIRETDHADATRISELVAYDRSTLGSVLERLESKLLIERRPGRGDRRLKVLVLTQAGRRLLDEVEPAVLRAQDILAPLASAERAVLMDAGAPRRSQQWGVSRPAPAGHDAMSRCPDLNGQAVSRSKPASSQDKRWSCNSI